MIVVAVAWRSDVLGDRLVKWISAGVDRLGQHYFSMSMSRHVTESHTLLVSFQKDMTSQQDEVVVMLSHGQQFGFDEIGRFPRTTKRRDLKRAKDLGLSYLETPMEHLVRRLSS